jgi:hypothetical protein
MTQIIELPKLRTFDLLSPYEQAAIRRHCSRDHRRHRSQPKKVSANAQRRRVFSGRRAADAT